MRAEGPMTLAAAPPLLRIVHARGYAVFTRGTYNLNIVGIRSPVRRPGRFDDLIAVVYRDASANWVLRCWPATTDPGKPYLSPDRQLNPLGTAILAPGQYRGAYRIGPHGDSQYEALVQRAGPVTVYRDGDHDDVLDFDPSTKHSGRFGINIHAPNQSPYSVDSEASRVGYWSAGCQVFRKTADFRVFMTLCRRQVAEHPTWDTFTYTLIEEPDWGTL